MSSVAYQNLVQYMDKIQSDLNDVFGSYNNCLNNYKNLMQRSLTESESYINVNDLLKLHQQTKSQTMTEVGISFFFFNKLPF